MTPKAQGRARARWEIETLRPSSTCKSAAVLLLLWPAIQGFAAAQAMADDVTPPAASGGQATDSKPAPAAPAAPAKPDSAKPAGTAATVVNLKTIEGVMGKSVRSREKNEDMGRVVDVLVDGAGQVRAAVIDFGGFLGVGSRKVAVDWKTLDFADSIQSGSVKVTLTRDQVRQSPEYKADEPIVILEGVSASAKPAAVPAQPGHNQDAPAK